MVRRDVGAAAQIEKVYFGARNWRFEEMKGGTRGGTEKRVPSWFSLAYLLPAEWQPMTLPDLVDYPFQAPTPAVVGGISCHHYALSFRSQCHRSASSTSPSFYKYLNWEASWLIMV
jgi:hypothetical protein